MDLSVLEKRVADFPQAVVLGDVLALDWDRGQRSLLDLETTEMDRNSHGRTFLKKLGF
jgi:hypothetical protein